MKTLVNQWRSTYRKEWGLFLFCFVILVSIVLLHLMCHPVRVLGMDTSIFYMDEKYTLASWFTAVLAGIVGFVSLTQVVPQKSSVKQKLVEIGYGLFFLMLSLDEYFEVHEYVNTIVKEYANSGSVIGVLSHASWIFPLSIIIAGVFVLLLLKILTSKRSVRIILFVGSISFLSVLGFELLGSIAYGQPMYVGLVAIEEGMEMMGISLFLLASCLEAHGVAG